MMSPEHSRRRVASLALLATVTACSGNGQNAPSGSSKPNAAVPYPSQLEMSAPSTSPATDTVTDNGDTGAVPVATVVAGTVEVTGGDLPVAVVDGYGSGGGDLIAPAEWFARYGTSPLPGVDGPGVALVEATRRIEEATDGWARTDEANWLAMSSEDRDILIDELAGAAGVEGSAIRTSDSSEGGDCVSDTYPATSAGVVWVVQGCRYERFPRLVALGVSRSGGTFEQPAAVDPTIPAVIDQLDGTLSHAEVRFGSPSPDGSTLHLSAHVSFDGDLDTAVAVADGALQGWQRFPGENSLLLSGPTGTTWTFAPSVAVMDWAGRW